MSSFNTSQGFALQGVAELWKQGFLDELGISPFRFNDASGTVPELRQRGEAQEKRYYITRNITFVYPPISEGRRIEVMVRSEEWNTPMTEHTYGGRWEAVAVQVYGAEAKTANRRFIRVGHTMGRPCYWIDPTQTQEALEEKF